MISFDEAIAIIASAARPLGSERLPTREASSRVLAAPVIAAIDSPRANVSAMDGYAVRNDDLGGYPVSLKVVGESFPGTGWSGRIQAGQCVRIFTGAPLPAGSDRIVMQERVRRDGDVAVIDTDPGRATWVRPRAGDFGTGDEVVASGRPLDPAALIAVAGADVAEVEVYASPRVALLANGDELAEPGKARLASLAVPDSASLGVAALAGGWGAEVISRQRLPDDVQRMEAAAKDAAAAADLVVVIGGASVGDRDFAKAMFAPIGLLFDRISIRPGKPAWFGRASGKLVLGLPGNPTSALVTARLLLAPILSALQGRPARMALDWQPAKLARPLPACDARETFHRATLAAGEATPLGFQESHAQKALAEAHILIRQDASSPALPAGAEVPVLRL